LPDLELELRTLAAYVDLPAERELVPAVRARLAYRPRRHVPWQRAVVIAVLVLAVGLGAAMAVPDARTAILRFFGLEGVSIVRVSELPPAGPARFYYSDPVTLQQAQQLLGFRPLLPDVGPPDQIRLSQFSNDVVVVTYGRGRARLRLTELHYGTIEKFVLEQQRVERVRVGDHRGVWIEGGHIVQLVEGLPELAGSTLLWEQNGLVLRLEGRLTKEQAIRIAESTR
jgi:hypothetical protein